jgi:glycosyltransferase involved in cell wall biosynthesis
MRKIKVLDIIQTAGIGGAEMVLFNTVEHLDKSRFDVRALVVGRGILIDRLREYGHEVDVFKFKKSYNLDLIKFIRHLIREHKIDIVHTHLSRMNMYGFVATRFTPAANVMTVHGLTEFSSKIGKIYYSIFGNLSGKVVTVSEHLADILTSRTLMRRNKICAIPNGIDTERFGRKFDRESTLRRFGVSPDSRVILAVGNLRAIKGYEFLLESFGLIAAEDSRLALIICGDDIRGYKVILDIVVAKLGLGDRVFFTEFIPDIEAAYSAADLYVLTSITEGFSLTTVEAMASSLPVISTDCVGPREIIDDGVDGLIIPERDPEIFGQAMLELIGDKQRTEKMGAAARKKVEQKFSIQESVRKFEQLFISLVSQ